MFKLYNCRVRLLGNPLNEVPKTEITAAEIEVLRALHGNDAVVGITEVGEVKRTSAQERELIYSRYASPATAMAEQVEKKRTLIRNLFGHDRLPLPTELEGNPEPSDDDDFELPEDNVSAEAKITVLSEPKPRRVRVPVKEEAPAFSE